MRFLHPDLEHITAAFARDIIRPNIVEWESKHVAPREIFHEAGHKGLLGLETPAENGGMGACFLDKLAFAHTLSQTSMAAAFALINSQNIAARLAASPVKYHSDDLAPQIKSGDLIGCTALTEPHAGSDFAAIKTAAKKVKGGWQLSGTKAWITNAAHADIIMLYAQTDPNKGWRGIASFLIDTRHKGFTRGKKYDLIGGHLIGAGEFRLDKYFVADDDMLAPPGDAFKNAMNSINGARTYVAAMCAGMISDALKKASSYSKERRSFEEKLLSHQGYKWSLVDVAVQLESLSLLTLKAGEAIKQGDDAVLSAAMAKKMAGEITIPAITACIQAMGANGLLEENLLGHHLAAAKIAGFADGSTEMMNERIAAYL